MLLKYFSRSGKTTVNFEGICICITEVPDSFLLSVVVEYIHSLAQHSVTPRQFVFELMINLCVRTNR